MFSLRYVDKEFWLAETRDKIDQVYKLLPGAETACGREDVREVAVILGSSRSGSSFLFSQLSDSGLLWTPQGEETPFYRLEDLGWIEGTRQSDELYGPWSPSLLDTVAKRLLRDVGREASNVNDVFRAQAITRLLLQWPTLELHPKELLAGFQELWPNWLSSLQIDPRLYALDGFASRTPRSLEFPEFLLEEPPFVAQTPRVAPTPGDLKSGILLLKTSSNTYRLPFLRALFPNAHFRWIMLTRNPGASINGLFDGWSSGAFHSHAVDKIQPLNIKGYSDCYPHGEKWWKFDAPPGWSDFANADLASVCAFQWLSAYERILEFTQQTQDPVLPVKYEDLVHQPSIAFQSIYKFLGLTAPPLPQEQRPIMASFAPGQARWREREAELKPHLERTEVIDLARKLHYDLKETGSFV